MLELPGPHEGSRVDRLESQLLGQGAGNGLRIGVVAGLEHGGGRALVDGIRHVLETGGVEDLHHPGGRGKRGRWSSKGGRGAVALAHGGSEPAMRYNKQGEVRVGCSQGSSEPSEARGFLCRSLNGDT